MKQWSLFIQWGDRSPAIRVEETVEVSRGGLVQFLWVEGRGGQQIDFSADNRELARYDITFPSTQTFDGFVRWAFDSATSSPNYEFVILPGCPECGTILDARDAGGVPVCWGRWHTENQSSVQALAEFMNTTFPRAVAIAKGDEFLAAKNLLEIAQSCITAFVPLVMQQINAVMSVLRRVGIPS